MSKVLLSFLEFLKLPVLVKKILSVLVAIVVGVMPSFFFTSEKAANKYLLTGDDTFSYSAGEKWTAGFGSSVLTPADVTGDSYYIAGYYTNNPAKGVMDDMYARALYLDDNTGRGGVVLCAVDCIGLSRSDINAIRKIVIDSKSIPNLKSINIAATHSHEAVDTQGLWGKDFYTSGRNNNFMENLRQKTANAIIKAYHSRRNGTLKVGSVQTVGMQEDVRSPVDYNKNLTRIRFVPNDGTTQTILVNYACHAELMGKNNSLVSADFPAYLGREIALKTGGVQNPDGTVSGGANYLFFNGAIGGMISSKQIMDVYNNPDFDCIAFAKQYGKELGDIALSISDEETISPVINIKTKPIVVPVDNVMLILARFLGVLNNDITRDGKVASASIYSEVSYLELGNGQVGMFLIPGELFPELESGNFLPAAEAGMGFNANYKVLSSLKNCHYQFVVGLANDELGYIIPDNDFVLHEWLPYINIATDSYGREHYEEVDSAGPATAGIILDAMNSLITSVK